MAKTKKANDAGAASNSPPSVVAEPATEPLAPPDGEAPVVPPEAIPRGAKKQAVLACRQAHPEWFASRRDVRAISAWCEANYGFAVSAVNVSTALATREASAGATPPTLTQSLEHLAGLFQHVDTLEPLTGGLANLLAVLTYLRDQHLDLAALETVVGFLHQRQAQGGTPR